MAMPACGPIGLADVFGMAPVRPSAAPTCRSCRPRSGVRPQRCEQTCLLQGPRPPALGGAPTLQPSLRRASKQLQCSPRVVEEKVQTRTSEQEFVPQCAVRLISSLVSDVMDEVSDEQVWDVDRISSPEEDEEEQAIWAKLFASAVEEFSEDCVEQSKDMELASSGDTAEEAEDLEDECEVSWEEAWADEDDSEVMESDSDGTEEDAADAATRLTLVALKDANRQILAQPHVVTASDSPCSLRVNVGDALDDHELVHNEDEEAEAVRIRSYASSIVSSLSRRPSLDASVDEATDGEAAACPPVPKAFAGRRLMVDTESDSESEGERRRSAIREKNAVLGAAMTFVGNAIDMTLQDEFGIGELEAADVEMDGQSVSDDEEEIIMAGEQDFLTETEEMNEADEEEELEKRIEAEEQLVLESIKPTDEWIFDYVSGLLDDGVTNLSERAGAVPHLAPADGLPHEGAQAVDQAPVGPPPAEPPAAAAADMPPLAPVCKSIHRMSLPSGPAKAFAPLASTPVATKQNSLAIWQQPDDFATASQLVTAPHAEDDLLAPAEVPEALESAEAPSVTAPAAPFPPLAAPVPMAFGSRQVSWTEPSSLGLELAHAEAPEPLEAAELAPLEAPPAKGVPLASEPPLPLAFLCMPTLRTQAPPLEKTAAAVAKVVLAQAPLGPSANVWQSVSQAAAAPFVLPPPPVARRAQELPASAAPTSQPRRASIVAPEATAESRRPVLRRPGTPSVQARKAKAVEQPKLTMDESIALLLEQAGGIAGAVAEAAEQVEAKPEPKRENLDALLADLDVGLSDSAPLKSQEAERTRPQTQQNRPERPPADELTKMRPRTQASSSTGTLRPRSRPVPSPLQAPPAPQVQQQAETAARPSSRSAAVLPLGEARNLGSSHASRRVIGGIVRTASATGLHEADGLLSPKAAARRKLTAASPTLCMMDADDGFGNQAARESSLARGYDALGCTSFFSLDSTETPTNGTSQGMRAQSRLKGGMSRPGSSGGLGGSFRMAASNLTTSGGAALALDLGQEAKQGSSLFGRHVEQVGSSGASALAMDLGEDVLREPKLLGKRLESSVPRAASLGSLVTKARPQDVANPPAGEYVRKSKRNLCPGATHSAGSVAWSVHMARAAASGTAGLRRHHSETRLAAAF